MQNTNEQRAELLDMIPRWQNSGLTQKAFCTNNDIAYHVFHYRYGVYKSNQNTTGSFVPVKISTPPNAPQVTITGKNGIQIQFEFNDQSVLFLKQLLQSGSCFSLSSPLLIFGTMAPPICAKTSILFVVSFWNTCLPMCCKEVFIFW